MRMRRLLGELVVVGLARELADTMHLARERGRSGSWLSFEGCIHRIEQLLLAAVPVHHRSSDSIDLPPHRASAVLALSRSHANNETANHCYTEHSKSFSLCPRSLQDGSIRACDVLVAGCAFSTSSCVQGVTLLGRQICCHSRGCAFPTANLLSHTACAGSNRFPRPPSCCSVCPGSGWGTGSVVKIAILRSLPPPPLPHFVPDGDIVAPFGLLQGSPEDGCCAGCHCKRACNTWTKLSFSSLSKIGEDSCHPIPMRLVFAHMGWQTHADQMLPQLLAQSL